MTHEHPHPAEVTHAREVAVTEDASAGRLHIDVVADASGFRRDLRLKIEAATKDQRAKVKADVQFSVIQSRQALQQTLRAMAATKRAKVNADVQFSAAQARRALTDALKASASAKRGSIKADVEFSAAQARRALGAALRDAAAGKRARLMADVEFSAAQARRALGAALRDAAAGKRARLMADVDFSAVQARRALRTTLLEATKTIRSPRINVNFNADTARMIAQAEAARRLIERRPIRMDFSIDVAKIGTAFSAIGLGLRSLTMVPAIVSGVLVAAGALTNLAAALFSVASAASQAVGVLAIVPGLAAAGAQGLLTLVLGFSGVLKAIQAMSRADQQAAPVARKSARSQINSTEQIRAARQRLADARQSAAERVADAESQSAQRIADAQKQASQRIATAERSLSDAQRNQQRAQEDLTQAREKAREEIQQLAFTLREATLSEEQAQINLEHARLRMLQSRQSVVMTPLDKRQAELDYRQAILDLEEARDRTSDLTKENEKAAKGGIDGSQTVRDARERLSDTNRDLRDAERELATARREGAAEVAKAQREGAKEIAKAHQDSARQITDAQRALKQALKVTAPELAATAAAVDRVGFAMDRLSPAGRRFAEFVHGTLAPRIREMQAAVEQAMLPGLQRGLKAAFPLLDTLQTQFAATGKIIGNFGERAGKLAGSAPFRADTAVIMSANNKALESFGNAGLHLANALRHVMVVASPLVVRFAELVEKWAKGREEAAKTGRETGRMRDWLEKAWRTAGKLVKIAKDLTAALHNVGSAATPSGDTMLDSIARGAERLRKWTADPRNQQAMRDFFDQAIPVAKQFADLIGRIFETLGKLGEAVGGDTLDGLFGVLNAFLDLINKIESVPAGGTILTTIFLLAGAGFGLALVSRALGRILRSIATLSRMTGASRAMSMLFGGGRRRGRSQVGELADDVEKLTGKIDDELPKDKKKSDAIGDIGDKSKTTSKGAKGLGDELEGVGKKAEKGAKKTSLFSRVIGGLGRGLGRAGKGLAGLGGLLLGALGLGAGKGASSAAASAASKGGPLTGFFATILGKFKLPSLSGALARVQTWFSGLLSGIRGMVSKITAGKLLGAVGKGAAKGGAKGGVGGPVGIVGGILAGIVGQLIGGGKGGVRGAVGGGISGAATGAGAGGLIGSVVPVIGTAIGAAVGAVVGAVVGAITGGKWWTAIGTFFATTLPNHIRDEAAKLPGRISAVVGAVGGLADALIDWAGEQLDSFGTWLGRAALKAVEKVPGLLVDGMFLGPKLLTKIWATAPDVYGWLIKQAQRIGPRLLPILAGIPGLIFHAIGFGLSRAPQAFGWLIQQGKQLGPRLLLILITLPIQIFRVLKMAFTNPPDFFAWLRRQANKVAGQLPGILKRAVFAVALALGRGFADALARVKKNLDEITGNVSEAGRKWRALFGSAMNSVRSRVSSAFTSVRDTIGRRLGEARTKVSDILGKIKNAFSSAKDSIDKIWRPIGRILAGPVNWIGQNVYTRGIKWVWDRVGKLVKKDPLPEYRAFASGGVHGRVLPGYTPRRDVHTFVSPTGGVLDMSGGEAVMVPEWTRAVGAGRVALWNQLARDGGPGAVARAMAAEFGGEGGRRFARGGIYQAFDIGGIFSGIKRFGSALKSSFSDGLANGASFVLNPILAAVPGAMGPGTWGDTLKRLPPTMVSDFLGFLTKVVEPKLGGDASAVVKAAASMIGRGDDQGPNNNWITRKWGMPGAAWCAMFVSEAIKLAKAEKKYPGYPSAAVASFVGAMKHVGSTEGRPGDLGAYRGTGHINVIAKNLGGGQYETIGGNENAVIRRGRRGGQSAILRPRFSAGGVVNLGELLARQASQVFHKEAPHAADRHEMDTPLVKFMQRLSPAMTRQVTAALIKTNTAVTGAARTYDTGGPVSPGTHLIHNGLRGDEWMIRPEVVDFLGGERVVAALNASAANLHRSSRSLTSAHAPSSPGGREGDRIVNVYPQPKQSEEEIGVIAARKMGAMLR